MAVTVDNTKGAYTIPALSGSGYVPIGGGTMTGALTIASGTLTASAPALSITQTWTTGAAFTGAVMNITDTSSTSGSLLVDLQIASVSKFSVTKAGLVTAQNFVSPNFRVAIGDSYDLRIGSTSALIWCVGNITAAADLFLYRDAAASLALRNGTNAQTLRVYGTYTDSSNYERVTLSTVIGSGITFGVESLGTGAGNLNLTLNALGSGQIRFGMGSGAVVTILPTGQINCNAVKTTALTFATLQSAATAGAGARAFINDGAGAVFGVAAAGGGANKVPVYSDGTNWLVG